MSTKASLTLCLQEDNSFTGTYSGTQQDLANMLIALAKDSLKSKTALYMATEVLLTNDGKDVLSIGIQLHILNSLIVHSDIKQ
jgi:hypothetical protein